MSTFVVSGIVGMFSKPPILADTFTGLANTAMPFPSGVFRAKWMTFGAMTSACLDTPAPAIVFSDRNGLQVVRVHAGTIATQVVNRIAWGDSAFQQFVCKTMGDNEFPVESYLPISTRWLASCPNPTSSRFADFLPESLFEGSFKTASPCGFATSPETFIVHEAHSFGNAFPLTTIKRTLQGEPPDLECITDNLYSQGGK